MRYYLKCSYEKGMFPGEYAISFRVTNPVIKNSMYVLREDVILISDNKGLVSLVETHMNWDDVLVGIKDIDAKGISKKPVPREDVVVLVDESISLN